MFLFCHHYVPSVCCCSCVCLERNISTVRATNKNKQTNKQSTQEKEINTRGRETPDMKVASACPVSFVQLIDSRALISLWAQDVVSFAWGLTSSLRARSLWHQHVVLSQHVPLCSQKPHSSDSGAPEKSWKGHLAMEVKEMSFRDSQTCLYSLLSLSPLKDRYCPYRWRQYLHGLLDKGIGVCLCSTVNHSISPQDASQPFIEGGKRETARLWRTDVQDHSVFFYVEVTWPQHSGLHMYPVANAHTRTHAHAENVHRTTSVQITIVAPELQAVKSEWEPGLLWSFRAREGLVQGHRGYVAQQHHRSGLHQATPNPHIQADRGVWRGETLSQIHAFYRLGLWTPSRPILMEPDNLLDTTAYSRCTMEWLALVWFSSPSPTMPSPNPLALPLHWVGLGLGADPLGPPPSGPSCITLSCSPTAAVLFFFIHVIGWSGGCFNPGLIPGVSLWVLICNTPLGSEPLPDWHPESTSRLWLHMQIHLLSLSATTLSKKNILFLFTDLVFGNLWLYCLSVLCVIKRQEVFSLEMLKYSCWISPRVTCHAQSVI